MDEELGLPREHGGTWSRIGIPVALHGLDGEPPTNPSRVLIAFSAESWHFSQTHGPNPVFSTITRWWRRFSTPCRTSSFSLKDATGRYVVVNRTLADRCAGGDKARLLGRRPADVFPEALAASYVKQDESVLRTGRTVEGALELHLYPGGVTLVPYHEAAPPRPRGPDHRRRRDLARDLNAPGEKANGYPELASVLEHMRLHFDESLRIEELAAMAGFSVYQFEQRVRRLFQMSPLQLLHKLRLDEATRLLRENPSLSEKSPSGPAGATRAPSRGISAAMRDRTGSIPDHGGGGWTGSADRESERMMLERRPRPS